MGFEEQDTRDAAALADFYRVAGYPDRPGTVRPLSAGWDGDPVARSLADDFGLDPAILSEAS